MFGLIKKVLVLVLMSFNNSGNNIKKIYNRKFCAGSKKYFFTKSTKVYIIKKSRM